MYCWHAERVTCTGQIEIHPPSDDLDDGLCLIAPANRLLSQTESVAGTPTRTWAYSYDPADRLTQALANPGGTYAYTLDAADNLLGQQTPTAAASNTYNALNQIVQRSGQPVTHDAAGNLTDDGTRTYAWDAEQRLVRIGYTGTGRSTAFRYEAFGRRTAVIEQDGATITETRYRWCGERICQARDGADTVTRRYYDEGELAVGASADSADMATFYAEDHLGSIRDLRMGDGQVLASYDYDPYGAPIRISETGGVRADYRYAGLVQHAQSGLYLTHYRAYSADNGRWISRDPIFEAGGVNLYAYVEGDPLNHLDPLGLWRWPQDIYNEAMRDAASRFPTNTWHNGPGDAYRHCLASCMVTQENTETEATIYGWANEKRGNWSHNQEKGEEKMDSANNAAGRSCGRTSKNTQDCIRGCLSAPLVKSYQPGSTPGYWE